MHKLVARGLWNVAEAGRLIETRANMWLEMTQLTLKRYLHARLIFYLLKVLSLLVLFYNRRKVSLGLESSSARSMHFIWLWV